jgi:hypothetical protein
MNGRINRAIFSTLIAVASLTVTGCSRPYVVGLNASASRLDQIPIIVEPTPTPTPSASPSPKTSPTPKPSPSTSPVTLEDAVGPGELYAFVSETATVSAGIASDDVACQNEAYSRGFVREYRALLFTRDLGLRHPLNMPVYSVNSLKQKQKISDGLSISLGLTPSVSSSGITYSYGGLSGAIYMSTGSLASGQIIRTGFPRVNDLSNLRAANCVDWTSQSSSDKLSIGIAGMSGNNALAMIDFYNCLTPFRVYCVSTDRIYDPLQSNGSGAQN